MVVHPREAHERARLARALATYERARGPLPGIAAAAARDALIEQLIDSGRRNRYVEHLLGAPHSVARADPACGYFDPLKAAILFARRGDIEEAFWMVFLFVHFGKHRRCGWRCAAAVYSRLGGPDRWDWGSVCADVPRFRDWMEANAKAIKGNGPCGFGNHRKYESLSGWSAAGTGQVVASYVAWTGAAQSQAGVVAAAASGTKNAEEAFDAAYESMEAVHRFGRTARFDYLAMVARLGLAPIRPGRAYLVGATGPAKGTRLLYGQANTGGSSAAVLDGRLVELEGFLAVGFDALEDALCNWQKSPLAFRPFRG